MAKLILELLRRKYPDVRKGLDRKALCEYLEVSDKSLSHKLSQQRTITTKTVKLLYLGFGISPEELKTIGYQVENDLTLKDLMPEFRKSGQALKKCTRIGVLPEQSSEDKNQFIINYQEYVDYYISTTQDVILINDYIGKGDVFNPNTKIESYLKVHKLIYKRIEKKLGLSKGNIDRKVTSLNSYHRILEIPQIFHWSNKPEACLLEAIALMPDITLEHVVKCVCAQNENIGIYISPLRRPYHFALFGNRYLLSEYYYVHDRVFYPDLLFIEERTPGSQTNTLFDTYQSEFNLIIEDNRMRITVEDLAKIFNPSDKEKNENHDFEGYISRKCKDRNFDKILLNIMKSYEAKRQFFHRYMSSIS